MKWLPIILLNGVFYGVYNFFIKLSSGHIHQIVGAVVLQIVATLLGVFILLYLKFTGHPLDISQKGVYLAALAGLFVGLAEITSFFIFSKGVNLSTGSTLIVASTILTAVLIGGLALKESLSFVSILGIVMTLGGIVMITSQVK